MQVVNKRSYSLADLAIVAGIVRSFSKGKCKRGGVSCQIIVGELRQPQVFLPLQCSQLFPNQAVSRYILFARTRALETKYSVTAPGPPRRQNTVNFGRGNWHLRIELLDELYGVSDGSTALLVASSGLIVGTHSHARAHELPELDRVSRLSRPAPLFFLHLHSSLSVLPPGRHTKSRNSLRRMPRSPSQLFPNRPRNLVAQTASLPANLRFVFAILPRALRQSRGDRKST